MLLAASLQLALMMMAVVRGRPLLPEREQMSFQRQTAILERRGQSIKCLRMHSQRPSKRLPNFLVTLQNPSRNQYGKNLLQSGARANSGVHKNSCVNPENANTEQCTCW